MAAARLFVNKKTIKKDGTTAVYALVHIDNMSIKKVYLDILLNFTIF